MDKSGEYEEAKSQMRRGMLEFCTLLIIGRGKEVYASDILKQLKAADLIVVEGTLYPLLSRLKSDGLLDYDWKESTAGPPRKYYTLTAKGKEKLSQLRATWKSLVESITTLLHN
jgi:PadR family transcriptional regulator PadR